MSMDVSTCNLIVNSNENTIDPVHYYRFLTIYMCKYYDKYIKLFSKGARHSAPSILVPSNLPGQRRRDEPTTGVKLNPWFC